MTRSACSEQIRERSTRGCSRNRLNLFGKRHPPSQPPGLPEPELPRPPQRSPDVLHHPLDLPGRNQDQGPGQIGLECPMNAVTGFEAHFPQEHSWHRDRRDPLYSMGPVEDVDAGIHGSSLAKH